jgi:hypothetical protein
MGLSTSALTPADRTHDPVPTLSAVLRGLDAMVASAEPAVVFVSAVRLCVSLICESATVTMTGPDQQAYAITWPWNPTDQRQPSAANTVRTSIIGEPTEEHAAYFGALILQFGAPPGDQHAVLAQLVVDRATALVHRERLTDLVACAQTRAVNLEAALESNREIGIAVGVLMSLHKVTKEHAFDVLRAASQRTHRKLRDVAVDVTETGSIELLVDRTTPMPHRVARGRDERSDRRPLTQCAS